MFRTIGLLVTAGLAGACLDGGPSSPTPPPSSRFTFSVAGTVLDPAGAPVQGARIFVVGTPQETATDPAGRFELSGLRGAITLWIEKPGVGGQQQSLVVFANVELTIQLAGGDSGDILILGAEMSDTVEAAAAPCDRIGWDANAPCRRYFLLAPETGTLTIDLGWPPGGSQLDATVVRVDGTYVGYSLENGPGMARLAVPLDARRLYQVRVNSYYETQAFVLRAVLTP